MTSGSQAGSRAERLWRLWPRAVCLLLLAILLWPLWGVSNPRLRAAQMALAKEPDPVRRAILDFQKTYALTGNGRRAGQADLSRLWAEMESFKGPHPEFFWMALCLLEARSGDFIAAKKALQKARAVDPKIVFLADGRDWAPWRGKLGLDAP